MDSFMILQYLENFVCRVEALNINYEPHGFAGEGVGWKCAAEREDFFANYIPANYPSFCLIIPQFRPQASMFYLVQAPCSWLILDQISPLLHFRHQRSH